jgi:hypothetical protein
MNKRLFLAVSFFALFSVSPASIHAWEPIGDSIKPVRILPASREINQLEQTDFDDDGISESIEIIDGQFRIMTGPIVRWQTPAGWVVSQAGLTDLNQDGAIEAILLVWRRFKPWPVDQWLVSGGRIEEFHNSAGDSCHILLIGWHRGRFTERWAGSALAQPVARFALADLNGDGFDELITLVSSYEVPVDFPAHALKVWEWNGFGFSLVSEQTGVFNDLKVVLTPDLTPVLLTP